MEEKDLFKFRVTPLSADNYFSWSNDMQVILLGKGLWEYVVSTDDASATMTTNTDGNTPAVETLSEQEAQKCDLALAYLLLFIDTTCKVSVRMLRCPMMVWSALKMFKVVCEEATDAKMSHLQTLSLDNGEELLSILVASARWSVSLNTRDST